MTKVTCSINGCEKPFVARGWCSLHWKRWRKHGDPLMLSQGPTPEARFWSYVDKHGPDGFHSQTGANLGPCWLWTGVPTSAGYSQFRIDGPRVKTHRFSYKMLVGPIPPGLQLDHLCRIRHCVNPDHLEPVTQAENIRRGQAGAHNATKTHCLVGHAFTPENTYVHQGQRRCRTCRRDARRAWAARQVGRPLPPRKVVDKQIGATR
jgi:hypothetical protein